jgi:drug/metabolite transporter (DMT)-like permease
MGVGPLAQLVRAAGFYPACRRFEPDTAHRQAGAGSPRQAVTLTAGMTAVLLALLTAVSYGVANFLGPRLSLVHGLGPVLVVGQVVGVAGALVLAAVQGDLGLTATSWALAVGAGLANALAIAVFFEASARGPMSVVAPLGATGGMVPVLVALALGERPSALQLAGIPLAVAGVVAAAARPGAPREGQRNAATTTVWLTLLSAMAFGLFLTCFAEASDDSAAGALLVSRVALLATTLVWLTSAGRALWVPARSLLTVGVPGLLLVVGTGAYGAATRTGLVSVVSVLATLAPVVVVVLAVTLLHERLAPRQWAGVGLAMVGVLLIAAG